MCSTLEKVAIPSSISVAHEVRPGRANSILDVSSQVGSNSLGKGTSEARDTANLANLRRDFDIHY
jgi:hypothetical protein